MADKEKKVKKKKKEDGTSASETPTEAPTPEPAATPASKTESTRQSSRASGGGSKRQAKRTGSNVFSMFSQKQVAEFKEAFQLMDCDKDGTIGKNDLRATFDSVGKLVSEKELDEMLGEASGPINFTQLLTLFASRMASAGASDDDDVVVNAFKTFDVEGKIDGDKLRTALMTWGDRFSADEVDDAYDQMVIDDKGFIDTAALISMLTGKDEEEEEA
uniref:Putative myosin regulatory light chain ef-hand protein n=1 Tax=Nyssomyia neivai TaxID=330878 RepID=A0A1L8E5Y9_9DIPT